MTSTSQALAQRIGSTCFLDGEASWWFDTAKAAALIERELADMRAKTKAVSDEKDRLRQSMLEVLVETNFISLAAARDYISEVLQVGAYATEQTVDSN